ncbi:hypothetical protein BDW75DRAFT_104173 [Aspergillus navahoensis]
MVIVAFFGSSKLFNGCPGLRFLPNPASRLQTSMARPSAFDSIHCCHRVNGHRNAPLEIYHHHLFWLIANEIFPYHSTCCHFRSLAEVSTVGRHPAIPRLGPEHVVLLSPDDDHWFWRSSRSSVFCNDLIISLYTALANRGGTALPICFRTSLRPNRKFKGNVCRHANSLLVKPRHPDGW